MAVCDCFRRVKIETVWRFNPVSERGEIFFQHHWVEFPVPHDAEPLDAATAEKITARAVAIEEAEAP
jgi:hypothetical protein